MHALQSTKIKDWYAMVIIGLIMNPVKINNITNYSTVAVFISMQNSTFSLTKAKVKKHA